MSGVPACWIGRATGVWALSPGALKGIARFTDLVRGAAAASFGNTSVRTRTCDCGAGTLLG